MRKIACVFFVVLTAGAGLAFWHNSSVTKAPEAAAPDSIEASQPALTEGNEEAAPHKASRQPLQTVHEDIAPIAVDKEKKSDDTDDRAYEEYQYSLKKKKSSGFQLMPGVTVKDRAIHIKQAENSDQSIDIERNPKNSNNDYQVTWKKKF